MAGDGCDFLYAGDLNYDATQAFPFPSGVGTYRSTPRTLATCPQGDSNGGQFFGGSFTGPSQQAWVGVAEPGSTTFKRYPIYREDQVMRGHTATRGSTSRGSAAGSTGRIRSAKSPRSR